MNPWLAFQTLIPKEPVLVAEVLSHDSDGRSLVELPTGETMIVLGQEVAAGNWAYIKEGRVQGPAPNLPVVEVTV